MRATFCYQTFTPESAEYGDCSDHGFYVPGLGKFSVYDMTHKEHVATGKDCELTDWRLAEVLRAAKQLGIHIDVGNWFESSSDIEDYGTGEEVTYSLHIEGVTPSTYARIARVLES